MDPNHVTEVDQEAVAGTEGTNDQGLAQGSAVANMEAVDVTKTGKDPGAGNDDVVEAGIGIGVIVGIGGAATGAPVLDHAIGDQVGGPHLDLDLEQLVVLDGLEILPLAANYATPLRPMYN